MTKIAKYTILCILVLAVAAAVYFMWSKPTEDSVNIEKGRIADVRTMAQLCTVDIYSEVPVLDTINRKVIFGVQKQKGSISFDIDSLAIDDSGDTVRIVLGPEIIELYESTDDNSWAVIDTKPIGPMALFRSGKFSDKEENQVKSHIRERSKRLLYRNGTVARARAEATENLQQLMEYIYRRPVEVRDTTPEGAYRKNY